MTLGSTVQATVKGTRTKDQFRGRVGVMTVMTIADNSRYYFTIPTHIITSALRAANLSSPSGDLVDQGRADFIWQHKYGGTWRSNAVISL